MSEPAPRSTAPEATPGQLLLAATAAFCAYFCTYAFRKPFTAGTYEDQEVFGWALKITLVISQLLGYMLSKFIGIKVISEMRSERRALAILGLIAIAEAALVGFAFLPVPLKVVMMFLNGIPLGMVFGLIMAYLEGRRQTELLTAALCASFIVASGVVKSVGRWVIEDWDISEFLMPMVTGLLFLPGLLLSVWVLQLTPPPSRRDEEKRTRREAMDRAQRGQFLRAYWPGLSLLVFVYVALTISRTLRDDFAVEIWRDLGIDRTPSIFATTETVVGIVVTALSGLAMLIPRNRQALRVTMSLMGVAFLLTAGAVLLQTSGRIASFPFMVACGIGLYVPYVAFHTTVLERLIAAARRPCNFGFLMYLADSIGYLGYAALIILKTANMTAENVLPMFLQTSLILSAVSIVALAAALLYFERVLPDEEPLTAIEAIPPPRAELAPTEN